MKQETIRVIRPVAESDKAVIEAKQITAQFKVLPYGKVDKLLDSKASRFSSVKVKV